MGFFSALKCFFHRKDISALMQNAKEHSLKRSMGAFQLVILGIGAIVGAGIFVLVGGAANQHAGPAIILSFVLAGTACMCVGLCYAELASAIPISGSAYTYIYATFGEFLAWIVGSLAIVGTVSLISVVAVGWSAYFYNLLLSLNIHIPAELCHTTGQIIVGQDDIANIGLFNLPAFAISILVMSILYRGLETAAFINTIIVIIKVAVLSGFIAYGLLYIDPENFKPFIPENEGEFGKFGISGIVGGASVILLAFLGFEVVATAAQETKNPQRNLPIGIVFSILIAVTIYILVATALVGVVNYKELGVAQPIAIAVDKMGAPWFTLIIKAGAVIGLFSVVLGLMYGVIRVIFAITNDGLLPSILAKVDSKTKTPKVATLFVGVTISLLAATINGEILTKIANFSLALVFVSVCFACMYMRYTMPNVHRSFRCPLMPIVPLFGIAIFIEILFSFTADVYYKILFAVACATIYYAFYGYKNSKLQKELQNTIAKE